MTTDEALRDRLAQCDPAAGATAPDVLGRIDASVVEPVRAPRWRRPSVLLVAAAVTVMGLLALASLPAILPWAAPGGSTSDSAPAAPGTQSFTAEDAPATSSEGANTDSAQSTASEPGSTGPGGPASVGEPTMVRTASVLVGTENPAAAADDFLRTIAGLGGQVTSQTVVTQGDAGADSPVVGPMEAVGESMPWYPQGPGVWLTVQVPADKYQQALTAARATGEVVRLEQSAYDAGAQIADTDARIRALESSLARLRALMGDAQDVGDVIRLEDAIATRQADLDSLRAQQRELAGQTSMSQISLTLMDPADAKVSVDPSPTSNWALVAAWTGAVLMVLTLAVLGYRALRRRR